MITLYQFPTGFSLPTSVSQFCTKLEVYLRLTGREYQVEVGDPCRSPNKKLPYVRWSNDHITADSKDIIRQLERDGPALDQDLSATEREAGQELMALAEEALYFACLYSRFVDPNGWKYQRQIVNAMLPAFIAPVAPIAAAVIRRTQTVQCARNGFASRADYAKAIDAIIRIGDELGDDMFVLGDEIQIVDCSVWANLMHIAYTLSDNPARYAVRNDQNLMRYIDRVAELVDWKLPTIAMRTSLAATQ